MATVENTRFDQKFVLALKKYEQQSQSLDEFKIKLKNVHCITRYQDQRNTKKRNKYYKKNTEITIFEKLINYKNCQYTCK